MIRVYDESDGRPVSVAFAVVVLAALAVVVAARLAYGTITIEAGTRLCRYGFGGRRAAGSG